MHLFLLLVHPSAIIGKDVTLDRGTVVMASVVINCSTVIGKGCIINTVAIIEHDNLIENFVHISPGCHLAGNVRIGESTWIRIGSTVINNINVIDQSIIGAGSVVIKDIIEPGIYIGTPVKKYKK